MRVIGHVNSRVNARNFSDFLTVKGIENQLESEKDATWAVWIHSEEQLEAAKVLLAAFQANPGDTQYQAAGRAAEEVRDQKRKEQAAYESRVQNRRHLFRPLTAYGFGPLTFALIFLCVVVYVLRETHESNRVTDALSITSSSAARLDTKGEGLTALPERISQVQEELPELRKGELWRLITPIFLHFGIMHILANMLWLRDLGSMIEARQSTGLLALQVVIIAALSNLAEFFYAGGLFGGMSGVVYGLLGYIWIRGKYDPASGLYLHPTNVTFMMIWFFACWFNLLGPIANVAHTVGLAIGIVWGFISSLLHRK